MKTLFMIAAVAGSLFAQDPIQLRTEALRERLNAENSRASAQTLQFVSAMNVGPTVTGAPYSAEAVNESIQTLYDGNRIVEKSSTKVYRDSEGRERREEGSPMNAVFITDPVAKASYTLYPETKTVSKAGENRTFFFSSVNALSGVATAAPVAAIQADRFQVRVGTGLAYTKGFPAPLTVTVGPEPGSAKVEDLGTKMLEGVQVKGSRSTTVIPAGQIGNDRDIEVVDERWYSPELKLTVMTTHSDPRSGQTTYKLTNIQRIEQVRSLFEVPANYTVQNNPSFVTSPVTVKKE
jgi:hypothetical protein